jgi:cyclomaltodextrinase / maltogenic alpha-amylase / neopullulanase
MWYDDAVFYQCYPLGLCGAPAENPWDLSVWNGAAHPVNRISRIRDWIPHLTRLRISALYFSPVFQSDRHGYDTRDYYTIDSRLGSNEDFADLCAALHSAGIKVVLDGVFNHVGRGFWAFRDVLARKQESPYTGWFTIDWNRNSDHNDGFWYEGWEGHYDLVKLNLENQAVQDHLFGAIQKWEDLFKIDGLRLDVAYSLPVWFIEKLRREKGQQLVLIGEIIRDQYTRFLGPGKLHSCTGYECYKGIYSSLNDTNMFEIAWSFNRLYGPDGLCRTTQLFNFIDNHDVSRIASILRNKKHILTAFGLLFTGPGVPCIYYGSEWGIEGSKTNGDDSLRPAIERPEWNELTGAVALFSKIRHQEQALRTGTYHQIFVSNGQLVYSRTTDTEELIVAVNAALSEASLNCVSGTFLELTHHQTVDIKTQLNIPAASILLLKRINIAPFPSK